MTITLTVEVENVRADAMLSAQLPNLSRSGAQKLLEQGAVLCGEKIVNKKEKLPVGAVLTVSMPDPEPLDIVAQDIPLEIVYEDDDVVVVNKPVGMVVHPAPGHPDGTLVNALMHHCGDSLSGINGVMRPGIVHRIDRDTSGLIIVAKNDHAHLSLAAQLEDHSMYRIYEAVTVGSFRHDEGTVDAPIARHPVDRKRMAIDPKGRRAVTHWKVLARYRGLTHIQCQLETGRTHQIRIHLASQGHPLLGDIVYGAKKPVKGLAGQCLHAKTLRFTHPRTGEEVTVTAPRPEWFEDILRKAGTELYV